MKAIDRLRNHNGLTDEEFDKLFLEALKEIRQNCERVSMEETNYNITVKDVCQHLITKRSGVAKSQPH